MPNVKLASEQCATCIFRPGSPIDLEELRKHWGEYGHQTCHQFRIKGQRNKPDVWCRGFWNNEAPEEFKAFVQACGLVEIVEQRGE